MAPQFGKSIGPEVGELCRETDDCGSVLGGGHIDGLNWKKGSSSAVAGDREQLTGI